MPAVKLQKKVIGNKWDTYLDLLQADYSEGKPSCHEAAGGAVLQVQPEALRPLSNLYSLPDGASFSTLYSNVSGNIQPWKAKARPYVCHQPAFCQVGIILSGVENSIAPIGYSALKMPSCSRGYPYANMTCYIPTNHGAILHQLKNAGMTKQRTNIIDHGSQRWLLDVGLASQEGFN
eukprot:Gb_13596 [translate_table: standard]